MSIRSPQARFRINSSLNDYVKSFKAFAFSNYFNGKIIRQLEAEICQKLNIANAIAMPQARVGLYLSIAAIIEPGKEVVLSPNTIADVINMVICAGAKPVFCDIDPATGNLDPDLVEKLITPDTAAILITHLYGLVAPMDRFLEIKNKYNIMLIEDAAQAFGARRDKKYAGTIGDIGVYSFGMAKSVMAFYGGMLVTPHKNIAEAIREKLENFPSMDKKKLKNKIIS
ncbi:MAG: aminotransferase class I/II-fold pyridoxal phosphate-dependent enzyme, partial [Candidatus Omnitrophica bacterium]|nr:aminotransferase class I/II-fold pyridoxal phosphate-dependent enzyme [Candidatus Omnitrophota bacterium]